MINHITTTITKETVLYAKTEIKSFCQHISNKKYELVDYTVFATKIQHCINPKKKKKCTDIFGRTNIMCVDSLTIFRYDLRAFMKRSTDKAAWPDMHYLNRGHRATTIFARIFSYKIHYLRIRILHCRSNTIHRVYCAPDTSLGAAHFL